jgi:hypothetical protein
MEGAAVAGGTLAGGRDEDGAAEAAEVDTGLTDAVGSNDGVAVVPHPARRAAARNAAIGRKLAWIDIVALLRWCR